ncbi:LOW QUALITY PROTEIN: uncharacterized protein LOC108904264 [Anoplophora glabripennis]|uniref:LOW QUALITY PROTEIN: uncharacterized protein LOC108904264 n=1 Tax=Anoplophora glabripennis TaxID=217634 RepID=UPI0008754789|nr:LOW QUALITY PROTEIN: uncharacterized protein LOC108904264 [Anoplophora glabripennis]
MAQRAKKRRLDHLSWEEKVQRKKLKNRVAAQTSRDRKKAKMEQMEQALQQLFSQNEALSAECENLKVTNQRLTEENAELYSRLQAPCENCTQSRTVECEVQNGSTVSTLQPQGRTTHSAAALNKQSVAVLEDHTDLPSLPDLLDELNTDVDINSLEQLTQSLLQDIARDLETAAQKTDCQEPVCNRQEGPGEVVGTASTELESDGGDVLNDNRKSLEKDISEYLLLHHNYAAKPPTQNARKPKTNRRKLKAIRPKVNTNVLDRNRLAVDLNTPVIIAENDVSSSDILYGTYSEDSNSVTIIVDGNGIPISEAVTEIVSKDNQDASDDTVAAVDNNFLSVPTILGNVSPRSTSSSDNGYESLDSPQSLSDLDIWDQSVSELFPSLF